MIPQNLRERSPFIGQRLRLVVKKKRRHAPSFNACQQSLLGKGDLIRIYDALQHNNTVPPYGEPGGLWEDIRHSGIIQAGGCYAVAGDHSRIFQVPPQQNRQLIPPAIISFQPYFQHGITTLSPGRIRLGFLIPGLAWSSFSNDTLQRWAIPHNVSPLDTIQASCRPESSPAVSETCPEECKAASSPLYPSYRSRNSKL